MKKPINLTAKNISKRKLKAICYYKVKWNDLITGHREKQSASSVASDRTTQHLTTQVPEHHSIWGCRAQLLICTWCKSLIGPHIHCGLTTNVYQHCQVVGCKHNTIGSQPVLPATNSFANWCCASAWLVASNPKFLSYLLWRLDIITYGPKHFWIHP